MTAQEQIEALQREIHDLKLGAGAPESLQRHLQALQNELQNLRRSPVLRDRRRPRIAIVRPKPPPQAPLTDDEKAIWAQFFNFHRALLQYSGWVNRDQWLQMADVAADLTGAQVTPEPAPEPSGFPDTPPIWMWNAATQTWTPLPMSGGPYGWDSATQHWVLLEGGTPGTDFPTTPPIWLYNATTQAWSPLPTSGGPYGWDATTQHWVSIGG